MKKRNLHKHTRAVAAETIENTRAYYVPAEMQVRAVDSDGIFEGYAAVWNIIDSHGTRFVKGAFKKTLQERADQIKILDNHNVDEPIGKPIEMHEDDIGLFVRGQLGAGFQAADEMREKISQQVIDSLSIGFNITKDKQNGAVRDITEVKLYEFSPVTFPSNEQAKITNFRSMKFATPDNDPIVEPEPEDARNDPAADAALVVTIPNIRATEFDETVKGEELYKKQWTLMDSLHITLSDIWWSDMTNEEMIIAADTAIAKFHNQYLVWMKEWMEKFWSTRHEIMANKDLAGVFNYELRKADENIESMAMTTSFTADELRTLSRGDMLGMESRQKLVELPEPIQEAHRCKRNAMMESLCNELRSGGINPAEAARLGALLSNATSSTEQRTASTGAIETLRRFRENLQH